MFGQCRVRRAFAGLAFATAMLVLPATVHAQAPDAGNDPYEWPYRFPLWGEKLGERGIRFPLPFGIGLNYVFVDQPIEISRVAVGVNDSEMVDLSEILEFGDLSAKLHAVNLRADLWLLPFLNVYVMGNYAIQAETDVSIVEPFAFGAGAVQSGYGGGFGTTISGGAWGFFGTLDLNWTWNKMEKLEIPVGTFLLTPRVGRNFGMWGGVEWIAWVGAMRQVIESETTGEIRLSEAVGDAGDGGFQDKLQAWYDTLPPGQQAVSRHIAPTADALSGLGRSHIA